MQVYWIVVPAKDFRLKNYIGQSKVNLTHFQDEKWVGFHGSAEISCKMVMKSLSKPESC
ncbi:hypothetical protein Hamer_G014813 [Homarus americanus]|uniref:Uncharacterized protein n=1 Tax=Homarus americanus TaxID=6706 RepID=A0A8J5N1T9_HOMAM|nr:hypothetical protein Hamer_G014813 [Homarus americanus]